MSYPAKIHGELTTSAKAIPLVMDLIGEWTALEGSHAVLIPPIGRTVTLAFHDTYRNLGRELPRAAARIAEDYPEHTTGAFTIASQNGSLAAESYRVENGRVYRRTLVDAPEHRMVLHHLPARKGQPREVLVTERELLRIARPRRNGRHKHQNGNGRTN